jgi:hypothetical protein
MLYARARLLRAFGETMGLAFEAKFVDCRDALGGEILQLSFDTVQASHDAEERCTPYVLISRNLEFPGPATIEWHDGQNYDGGAEIRSLSLQRDRVSIKLDRNLELEVLFCVPDKKFAMLKSFLSRMIDARFHVPD